MARKAGGADQLAAARELLRTAKTADELRTAHRGLDLRAMMKSPPFFPKP